MYLIIHSDVNSFIIPKAILFLIQRQSTQNLGTTELQIFAKVYPNLLICEVSPTTLRSMTDIANFCNKSREEKNLVLQNYSFFF